MLEREEGRGERERECRRNTDSITMPNNTDQQLERRQLTMSFSSRRPNARTMALGGVLTGST